MLGRGYLHPGGYLQQLFLRLRSVVNRRGGGGYDWGRYEILALVLFHLRLQRYKVYKDHTNERNDEGT